MTNYDVLEALAAAYDLLAAVDRVIRMIDAIGVVSQASGSQIQQARAAYDALTVEQQKQITNRSRWKVRRRLTRHWKNRRPR